MSDGVHPVFWWNIPCSGMIHVLKAFVETVDPAAMVVTGTLSRSRKAMGWDDQGSLFPHHIVLRDTEWDEKGISLLNKYRDCLHIFNGITHPARMNRLIRYACDQRILFCNMSEAYANLQSGVPRIAKALYMQYILPWKTRPVAEKSLGVICLSGSSEAHFRQFRRLGFRKVWPFGYYTDEDPAFQYKRAEDGKIHILCPGLLEAYKGVDILIKALHQVRQEGYRNFLCHITGAGSQRPFLEALVGKCDLEDAVIFEGVLDAGQYKDLLSHIDVLVAPGRVEPWGIRVNEAVQRGNVVLVSDGIGAAELIKESGGGAVFKSADSRDLARKLCFFLSDERRYLKAKSDNLTFKEQISCEYQSRVLSRMIAQLAEMPHES